MSIIRAFFGFPRKNLSKNKGLFGYQIAGPEFTQQTKKPTVEFLNGVLTGWFQWSEAEAKQLTEGLAKVGKLSEEAVQREGVTLKSPDGREAYYFKKAPTGSWDVRRIRPDKPILKN